MAKQAAIEQEGTIIEALSNAYLQIHPYLHIYQGL